MDGHCRAQKAGGLIMTPCFIVFKVGGTLLEHPQFPEHFASELMQLQKQGLSPVVVHGGGKIADLLCERLGITVRKWKGRRVTDENTLKVVKMVYRGLLQTDFVAMLSAHGIEAMGLCGSDGWVVARKRLPVNDPDAPKPVHFGWVGDIEYVDVTPILELTRAGFIPIITCLATDKRGNVLNVNADGLAVKIALALQSKEMVFLTDVPGILKDPADPLTTIDRLTLSELRGLRMSGSLQEGMLPKTDAIEEALENGIRRVIIRCGLKVQVNADSEEAAPKGTIVTPDTARSRCPTHPRDVLSVLRDIIAIPSVSGSEEALADYLEDLLKTHGKKVERRGKSVVAVRGDGPLTLILNAHTDTVPPAQGWKFDPFTPIEQDGKIYGLGAVDCKGPLAAMLAAFVEWTPVPGKGRLVLTLTPEEETGGSDLVEIVNDLGKVDGAIIAEPTGMKPYIAQKGLLRLDVEMNGRAAHSSRPWHGENAIWRAANAVIALKALQIGESHPLLHGVTITPTIIRGGDVTNRVPEKCLVSLDIRYPPDLNPESIITAVKKALPQESVHLRSDRFRPCATPEDSRLMAALRRSFRSQDFAGFFGVSNWGLLRDIPAVVLGPGDPRWSHSAQENMDIVHLWRSVEIYRRVIGRFFGD